MAQDSSLGRVTSPVVLLAGPGPSTWVLANALRRRFGAVPVILEDKEPALRFLRRRLRRLGLAVVAGQVAFVVTARLFRPLYRGRERAAAAELGLDARPTATDVVRVRSVNDADAIRRLRELAPSVVVLSGTRIVSRRVLEAVPAAFINLHNGITPQYRGAHGGYWALARGDAAHCGATVHLVDAGVDTGAVIGQARIRPTPADNYFTYPWLQLAAGLPLLLRAVEDALAGRLETRRPAPEADSRQFYHPTLWGYLRTGLARGVW